MGFLDRLKTNRNIDIDDRLDLTIETPEPTIDVTDSRAFGRPTKCPECTGRGYLDHLDMIDRIQYQHCTVCAHTWEMTESQITAS